MGSQSTLNESSGPPFPSLTSTRNFARPPAAVDTARIAPGIGTAAGAAVTGAPDGELPSGFALIPDTAYDTPFARPLMVQNGGS